MNEIGVHGGPIRFLRARTRSLLDASTVGKKANFPHAHADGGPAGNSLKEFRVFRVPELSELNSCFLVTERSGFSVQA